MSTLFNRCERVPSSYFLSILRSTLGVLCSRILGLLRDVVIAGVYGATGITDIFFTVNAIPNLFRQFFAEGAMSSAFVPILSDKTANQGESAANTYLTQMIIMQTILITGLSLLMIALAPYVVMLFMPGYAGDANSVSMGSSLLRIQMPYLLFVSVAGLLAGFLNLRGSYFVSYASTGALNIMMVIGALIGYHYHGNIYCLAFSVIAGGIVQLTVVYIYAYNKGFRPGLLFPIDSDLKKTFQLIIPSLAGVGISQLNFLVGRMVASFLQSGSISWLFYANRLFQFPLGLFSVTISTVSLTELSKARTSGDNNLVADLIDKAVIIMLVIIIPSTIGLIGLAKELVTLIYARSAFTINDVTNTASALQMYSIGLIFFSLASVFVRVYHSEKNTKTPVKFALVTFFVHLILNIILMRPMQHAGIALSSSVAAMVNAALLYKGIKGYKFSLKKYAPLLLKIMVSSYAMLAVLIIGKIFATPVLITVSLCAVAYFGALYLMNVRVRSLFKK